MSNLELSRAQRLDQAVVEQLPTLSRAFAAKLIERGDVLVNGVVQTKAGFKLKMSDVLTVSYEVTAEPAIPDIELPIIYEDEDCVVINKPVGLLTHSKGAFNPEATVATWLRSRLIDMAGERGGIVHRLDRATSGVMICAKNPTALAFLQKQFSQRKAKKRYIAIVSGLPQPEHAVIDMPIERNPKQPQTFRVGANGKASITEYQVLQHDAERSLLQLTPQTGRTHQLRVHLRQQGHPIIGDTLYGGAPADRLYLHAESLEITVPSRERKTFTVAVPADFYSLIKS